MQNHLSQIPVILLLFLFSFQGKIPTIPDDGLTSSIARKIINVRSGNDWKLVYENEFSEPLDTDVWKIEMEPKPNSSVQVVDGKLLLNTKAGVTVWLNKMLRGDIEITYKRKIIVEDGPNDRLSDLNQFWMATDPRNEDLFTRSGKFSEYDSISMYYVGFGGNYNSTTRFRKYHGNGERELLYDLKDKDHLLKPNHEYQIRIRVENGEVSYWVDGKRYFQYKDKKPLEHGYFGFRSTWSRQEIDDLRIYQKE